MFIVPWVKREDGTSWTLASAIIPALPPQR